MTATEFVCKVRDIAKEQDQPVLAVDFAPERDRLRLTFRFKEKR